MDKLENVRNGVKACLTHNFFRKCYHCPYELYRDDSKCKDRLCENVLELLKEHEAISVDAFVQWCADSHIMGDASVKGIKYWAEKFKEGR